MTKSCLKRLILKPNIAANAKLAIVEFETLFVKSAKPTGYINSPKINIYVNSGN